MSQIDLIPGELYILTYRLREPGSILSCVCCRNFDICCTIQKNIMVMYVDTNIVSPKNDTYLRVLWHNKIYDLHDCVIKHNFLTKY